MRLPTARVAFAAFCAQAIAHTAGFAAVTGTSVRLRVYGNAGVSPAVVARLMVFGATAFALGSALTGGVAAVLEGRRVAVATGLPVMAVQALGVAILTVLVAYMVASARGLAISFRTWRLSLPRLSMTLGQTALAVADLVFACAVLWMLLPADLPLSFAAFLGLYAVAIVAGVIAHVPGGLGCSKASCCCSCPACRRQRCWARWLSIGSSITCCP
ncbi:hypothetical protein ACFQ4K_11265 [Tistrella bauzanensis]